jgi:hypothetical protein
MRRPSAETAIAAIVPAVFSAKRFTSQLKLSASELMVPDADIDGM